jgi:hypothetical protein
MELKTSDCSFILLVELPNKDIHQVMIEDDLLRKLVNEQENFVCNIDKITTIELKDLPPKTD